jgi:hypothetical protein
MSNKQKNLRKRLSLQNKNLKNNKLDEMAENMGLDKVEEEKEVTDEIDHLKIFSEEQRKKEKEEEAKKYLKPIIEEEDPLKYFEKNKAKEAEDEDPINFIKEKEELMSYSLPKMLGIINELNEEALAEKINKRDIPQEINIEKKPEKEKYSMEERKKKLEKRYKTSLRLTQRKGFETRAKDKLMQRLQNYKNSINAGDTIKKVEKNNEGKNNGNTLLSAEEQVSNKTNTNTVPIKKEVDLSLFMKKNKDDKNEKE